MDNDIHALDSLERLLRFEGFAVDRFTLADEFLEHAIDDVPSCVIAELNLADIDGLRLEEAMKHGDVRVPIVFVSGSANVRSTASAMRGGAVHFLEKPVDEALLLDAVSRALRAGYDRPHSARRRDEGSRITHPADAA